MLRSSGWTTRKVAVRASRCSGRRLPEALHHRLVGRHHVAVQIRQRYLRARARHQAEQAERRVGPAHRAGDEVLLPAAETAEPLRVIQERGQPVRRTAVPVPGEDHAVEEPGHPQVGQGAGLRVRPRQPAARWPATRAAGRGRAAAPRPPGPAWPGRTGPSRPRSPDRPPAGSAWSGRCPPGRPGRGSRG